MKQAEHIVGELIEHLVQNYLRACYQFGRKIGQKNVSNCRVMAVTVTAAVQL